MNKPVIPRRVLSVFSLVMINVIAVDSLRTLPISAEYGLSAIFYYLIAAIFFFVPTALVAAELATGWPATGGIYVWIRESFGPRFAFMIIWLVWIYNIIWYPTLLAFLAGTLIYWLSPGLLHYRLFLVNTMLLLFWFATLANCFGMRIASWVSTLGGLFGTLLPIGLIIFLGGYWLYTGHPSQIAFTRVALIPSMRSVHDLVLFVGILFGLIGMEMSAAHAEEVRHPQRDYPRALFISTILIISSLALGSLAIAIVVPVKELNLVTSLIEAFIIFFKAFHAEWMNPVVILMILVGGMSGMAAWIIGPTKGVLMASRDGHLPAIFSKVNRFGAPVPLLMLQAALFSVLCFVFILMPSVNSSYWFLTAMTSQLALIVYVVMFAAVVALRKSQPDVHRSFHIPGGWFGLITVAGFGIVTCVLAILVGFFPPAQFSVGDTVTYVSLLIAGILIFCGAPWLISIVTERRRILRK